jgi:hypothetical protein
MLVPGGKKLPLKSIRYFNMVLSDEGFEWTEILLPSHKCLLFIISKLFQHLHTLEWLSVNRKVNKKRKALLLQLW